MSTYRPRLVEVHALDCGDGRHVLLTEPPRYMPSLEFLEAFELVEAHRNGGRPKAGKRAKGSKAKVARRAKASGSRDEDPKKAEAQRMYEKEGLKLAEIERRLKIPYSRLWYWAKQWKAPTKPKAAEVAADDDWMK